MGAKQSGTTQSTQTTTPWAPQQPYLESIFSNAKNLYGTGGPQYYPGTTYAPPTDYQTEAINAIAQHGLTGSQVTDPATQFTSAALKGSLVGGDPALNLLRNPDANSPVVQQDSGLHALTNFLNPGDPGATAIGRNVMSSVLPTIEGQFEQNGRYGSPGMANAAASGATNALAPYYMQAATGASNAFQGDVVNSANANANAYGTDVGHTVQSLALAPQTQAMPYTDFSQALSAGQESQNLSQQAINDQVQRYNYGATLPWQNLNQYIGQVTGNYGGTTQLNQPYFSNPLQNIASGIGAAGSAIGGISSLVTPAAATGVSPLGALGTFLGIGAGK